MDKEKTLKELKEKFKELKKEVGFKAGLEELDSAFHIQDAVLAEGFVYEDFSRQICLKIIERFMDWHNYLNSLILPNPSFLANQTEAKLFSSSEDKKLIWKLMTGSMKFSSMALLDSIKEQKSLTKELVDGSLDYWKKEFQPNLEKIMKKIHEAWKKE